MSELTASPKTPYRQIRAVYDDKTITVYQAYSEPIADAAVAAQRLDASPMFRLSRMTWIKPSWCWMLYRAGYGLKDAGQAHILAIKITRAGFEEMLRSAELTHAPDGSNLESLGAEVTAEQEGDEAETAEAATSTVDGTKRSHRFKLNTIRVQWDPERSPRLGKLDHRSIQIGIPGGERASQYVNEWIRGIEDVTGKAQALKATLDANKTVSRSTLIEMDLLPFERVYPTPSDIVSMLHIDTE